MLRSFVIDYNILFPSVTHRNTFLLSIIFHLHIATSRYNKYCGKIKYAISQTYFMAGPIHLFQSEDKPNLISNSPFIDNPYAIIRSLLLRLFSIDDRILLSFMLVYCKRRFTDIVRQTRRFNILEPVYIYTVTRHFVARSSKKSDKCSVRD